jgi:hypothetical protein
VLSRIHELTYRYCFRLCSIYLKVAARNEPGDLFIWEACGSDCSACFLKHIVFLSQKEICGVIILIFKLHVLTDNSVTGKCVTGYVVLHTVVTLYLMEHLTLVHCCI